MVELGKWILAICGVTVVSAVAELLFDGSRMHKMIRYVCGIAVLLCVASPLATIVGVDFSFDEVTINGSVCADSTYLAYVERLKWNEVELGVEKELKNNGFPSSEVAVTYDFDGKESTVLYITVSFEKEGIAESDEHINMNEVRRLVSEFVGVDDGRVMVNG